jgi:DNA adenine methylase
MAKNKPLFMWAGGKSRMLKHYAPLLPTGFTEYVEPFLGGGAFYSFVREQNPEIKATLSDVNAELMDMYLAIQKKPNKFMKELRKYESAWLCLDKENRKKYYYEKRAEYWVQADPSNETVSGHYTTEASALLYFLMKTGFNGIWQSCVAAKGLFATPCGLANQEDKVFNYDLIRTWHDMLQTTELSCGSYLNSLTPKGSFVYCDPPYRGSFTSYNTNFGDQCQQDLVSWCREKAANHECCVWLSNRDVGDGWYETYASDAKIQRFDVTYTAGRRKRTETGFAAKPAVEVLLIWDGR